MAKKSSKVTVVNNHFDIVEIPLLSGEPNYILKPGEEASLEFDPETAQMKGYRVAGLLSVKDGEKEVPVDLEEKPLASGETVTFAPGDKPATTL